MFLLPHSFFASSTLYGAGPDVRSTGGMSKVQRARSKTQRRAERKSGILQSEYENGEHEFRTSIEDTKGREYLEQRERNQFGSEAESEGSRLGEQAEDKPTPLQDIETEKRV